VVLVAPTSDIANATLVAPGAEAGWTLWDAPGDELRFIRRYLANRTDRLPWLFLSERGQLARDTF
jgi:hypothetical protein